MSMQFNDFTAFQAYLDSRGQFRMNPGIGRIAQSLDMLGLKKPPYTVTRLVGTNGKGSTSTFLTALAAAHGLRVGLFTSPHFLTPRERILLWDKNGRRTLSETRWTELANKVMRDAQGEELTYFELITAMGVLAFSEHNIDLAVLESGLGGRFDATGALNAELTLFTPFGLDHEHVLGKGLKNIATDKAHALGRNGRAISAPQPEEAQSILTERARNAHAELRFIQPDAAAPRTGYQKINAALAKAAWETLATSFSIQPNTALIAETLKNTHFPGRLQRISASSAHPPLILDGAHNADGLRALKNAINSKENNIPQPEAVIFACLKDKDLKTLAPHVLALSDGPLLIPGVPTNERSLPPEELAAALGRRATPVPDLKAALHQVQGRTGPVLLCGSLFLLADFFTLHPDYLGLKT